MNVRKKRGSGLLILYLTAVLFSLSAAGCAFVNVTLYQPALPLQEKVIEGEGPGKVLLMDI
ncbi:MAG: hypothetical protein PVI84_13920, partial [Syntrophobacterales bacterium]